MKMVNNPPCVSIIIPTYNVESYIRDCLDSVLAQTMQDIEIIIIDDGSTDRSGLIANEYSTLDERILVISQSNQGLPSARNRGIERASGTYLCFVDPDDIIDRNMLRILKDTSTTHKVDLAVCNIALFDRLTSYYSTRYINQTIMYTKANAVQFYSFCLDSCCNKMFRRDLIIERNIRFEPKSIVPQEDFYFLMKYITFSQSISSVSENLYFYRVRTSSISNSRQSSDFSSLCVNFPHLIQTYHDNTKSDRVLSDFLEYTSQYMLFASINQMNYPSIRNIKLIYEMFLNDSIFLRSLKNNHIDKYHHYGKFHRLYFHTIMVLLKWRFINIASLLENTRVSRLYSKKKKNAYD